MIKTKKGSHVGMILSFVIFATFLIFLYSVLQPSIKIKNDKENLVNNLEIELTKNFYSERGVLTFVINNSTSNTCVNLKELIGAIPSLGIIVKNESSDVLSFVRKNNNDLIINRSVTDNSFFKVYFSDEFKEIINGNPGNCDLLYEGEYLIKSSKIGEEIFLSKINKTIEEYETNYSLLKEKLNIPIDSHFGFTFKGESVNIGTKEKNTSTSIYAREIPILYVDDEANIKSGFLIMKVW